MRYFLKLSFFGTRYHGWQIQENARSIQEVVNNCLSETLNEKIHCFGCGRTDAGAQDCCLYLKSYTFIAD